MTLDAMMLAAVRAAVILAVALAALRVLRGASAATRRSLLVGAFLTVLVLPVATAVLPALHLRREAKAPEPQRTNAVLQDEPIVEATTFVAPATLALERAVPSASPTRPVSTSLSLDVVLLAAWALGVVAVLARLGLGVVRARRLARSARFVETLDVEGWPVEVRISRDIETPAVTGLFVPTVLLPPDGETWSDERRRIVLAHELAHVVNRDCLAGAIAQLAVAMHWFNPLAWLAARRLRLERELAADDRVLDQGVLASSYAEHLLALATSSDRAVPAGVLAMAEPSQISTRIRSLLAPRTRTKLGRARFALAGTGIVLATFVACATPEREPAPQADPPSTAPVAGSKPTATAATTIDPQIQAIADDEIERMNKEWSPCAAIVLVLDPHTGHVLAAAHRGGTESTNELAAARPMVAGSTMKPLVIAAALEEGVIHPTDRFDASPELMSTIKDATPHGMLDVREILSVSSNVGLAKIHDKLGGAKLAAWGKRFHLASMPATVADGPAGAGIAIGNVSSTPLEVAAAFSALANNGIYHTPTFTPGNDDGERVLRGETAATVLGLLEGVTGEHGTGAAARVEGIRVAGKTGTAHLARAKDRPANDSSDYYASFVGTAPLENPRYVVFVGAETPRDGGSGGKVAAPVFGRIMARLLAQ